jgi:hypothetical protein
VELEHCEAQLAASRQGVAQLQARMTPLEAELAILVADRGRCVVLCCVVLCCGGMCVVGCCGVVLWGVTQ